MNSKGFTNNGIPIKGNVYFFKSEPEPKLEYIGINTDGSGLWHQFAKADDASRKVWAELRTNDLHLIEAYVEACEFCKGSGDEINRGGMTACGKCGGLGKMQVRAENATSEIEKLKLALHETEAERAKLKEQLDMYRGLLSSDTWIWQGDGTDDLASMGNKMLVVIRADQLRQLLKDVFNE